MPDHPATTGARTGRIVVVGSINVDLVVRVATLPRPGETVLGGRFASVHGGKGANQAVAAARAGGHTTFVARVGDDSMGRSAIEAFRAEGIETDFITVTPECPTGVALILVDAAGENSIAVAGGANDRLSPDDIERARPAIEAADVVLLQLEIPLEAVQHAVTIARATGTRVILNPAPARPLPATLLAGVDILTPNETEAESLASHRTAGEASAADIDGIVRTLLALGPRAVVVTLGAAGALVAAGQALTRVPAFPVEPRDTVAAGDVFNGCLAVMLAEGLDLVAATRFAAAAAAISVTREGAQASAPHRNQIEAFLAARSGA
ncbi:MAG: ribokinase [Planctomycetota bacterium]|nr:MAG: ribokinase [Planctomycetota bacterium]